MNKKISNPFVTGGYISPVYFCDREAETEKLKGAVESKRNITLISIRRMGKTGLLKHLKHRIEDGKKSTLVIYADLLPTMNGREMLKAMVTALLSEKKNDLNIIQKLLTLLARLRPKMTLDPLTGQPSLELGIESPDDIQFGFENLMSFIMDMKQDMVFMIDEFQQITAYPEKNTEQILRTIIQAFPSIPFIFSGSSKHMLEPMFNSAGRPFYQSSEIMYLEKIQDSDYKDFISGKFLEAGRKLESEALSEIMRWTRGHTFYVQYVCNRLYEIPVKMVTADITHDMFKQILDSYDPLFVSYRNLLPSHQFRLLQAIAVENGIDKPTSGSFINLHELTGASSVKTSLKSLADKEMIVSDGSRWQVYDVFFSRWLEYHYS
jgi:AAA+ ATPase superfamily predicted ATPase